MTYTESNESFVSSILKPFFRESGLNISAELFNDIVERICTDDNYTTLNMTNSHDYITQKGLNLLKEIQKDKYSNM